MPKTKKYLTIPRKDSNESLIKDIQEKKLDVPLRIVEPGEIKVKLSDIGGYEEAKVEVVEFINFINHSDRYLNLGARLPRGVLLSGPPGTGKTLLVKALAGEGNIPFLSVACASILVASDGPKKLRKVFQIARQLQPCVLFFDEVDCISKSRTRSRRSTIQHISLTEEFLILLDGFEKWEGDKNVIIIGATNEEWSIDKAFRRPGRFDRVIDMPAPDLDARTEIARIHLRSLKTNLDKNNLAYMIGVLTADLAGADVANVCNEAAMIAARNLADHITMEHFNESFDRVRFGLKKRKAFSDNEKRIVAYHEAGHAVVAWHLPGVELVNKLNIMPNAKGDFVCSINSQKPHKTALMKNRQELIHSLVVTLSGLAAEEVVFGKYRATGAIDLEAATVVLLNMATENGHFNSMGKILSKSAFMQAEYQYYNEKYFQCGDQMTEMFFNEMKILISEIYETAKGQCLKYRAQLDQVATYLLEKNVMNLDDLQTILGPHRTFDAKKFSRADSVFILPPSLQAWNTSD